MKRDVKNYGKFLKLWDMFETMVKEKCFKEIINGTEENNSETETTQD